MRGLGPRSSMMKKSSRKLECDLAWRREFGVYVALQNPASLAGSARLQMQFGAMMLLKKPKNRSLIS